MQTRPDIYTKVTAKIIADLELGNLTWLQPWQSDSRKGHISRPLRSNGKAYQGINTIMLWASAVEQGFTSPVWMTFKQAEESGGHVRKGEKGSQVVYADSFTRTRTDEKGNDTDEQIPFLKSYIVFNCQQIEGLPTQLQDAPQVVMQDHERIAQVERFIDATGAAITHSGDRAFFSPSRDMVYMPELGRFTDSESYYATLAHELVHWTSVPARLDRNLGGKRFGDVGYAMEELVAEIGAAFLCADLHITPETREDHAAYIATWLCVLRNDKRAIFTAATHAQRAVDWLHMTVA